MKHLLSYKRFTWKLFVKKMLDYGPGNIAMGTGLQNVEEINFALLALAIRMNDKVQRLLNLLKKIPLHAMNLLLTLSMI